VRRFHTLLLSIGLALIPNLQAASFDPQPFPEAVQEAPVIIRGKIGMSYSDWGSDEGIKRLFTYFELQVSEVLKGPTSQNSITFRELGGEKDGTEFHISGSAHFESGEDVVVFLKEKNIEGAYELQGMMMGKYNVETDSNGEYLTGPALASSAHWTLNALRQLIQNQSNLNRKPLSAPVRPILILPSPSLTPTSLPPNEPSNLKNSLIWIILGIGLGLIGIIGIIRLRTPPSP
jgi:hypothetical protein